LCLFINNSKEAFMAATFAAFSYGVCASTPPYCGAVSDNFESYDVRKVNEMPHVHGDILNIDIDNRVQSLLEVVSTHGLEEQLAVWRIHRHFDVNPGEQIVTTLDSDNQSLVTHVVNEGDCNTVPIMWSLSQDGKWQPMQFWAGPRSDIMEARLEIVKKNQEFWKAYTDLIKHMGAESLIGISIRQDNLLGALANYTLVEGTRDNFRYQLIKNVPNEDVDAHFKSCIARNVLGELRITHWSHHPMQPRTVGCQAIGCMTCGLYGSCYNHWPTKDQLPARDQFELVHIPRFRELIGCR
jgi:hypothetical protein